MDPKVIKQLEITEQNSKKKAKAYVTILLGLFFILWSYFTYNDGVIHNKGGERVIASIESSPKKFYFFIFGAIGLGCITVAHGIETIVKQKKALKITIMKISLPMRKPP